MAITKTTVVDGLYISIVGGVVNAAHVSQVQNVVDDGVIISQLRIPPVPVAAIGPLSLAGVLSTATAAALAGAGPLQAQIDALNTTISDQASAYAALQARYDALNPPEAIPHKAISQALAKLERGDAFGKAVELADQVEWWWKTADAINPLGPQWLAIVAEMDKAGMWGKSSETALLALAREIASPFTASVAE